MFPVYHDKYLSRKVIQKWTEKRGKRFADDEEVETEVRKWLRQQSKDFYAVGFDALVNAMVQVYLCCWRIYREINVVPRLE
jgi:hypothetical protein